MQFVHISAFACVRVLVLLFYFLFLLVFFLCVIGLLENTECARPTNKRMGSVHLKYKLKKGNNNNDNNKAYNM